MTGLSLIGGYERQVSVAITETVQLSVKVISAESWNAEIADTRKEGLETAGKRIDV